MAAVMVAMVIVPNASAGTATGVVIFGGTVTGGAVFSNPTPGILGTNNTFSSIGSNSSGYSGAGSAHINITLTGPSTLTISDPIRTGGTGTSVASSAKAILTTSAGQVQSPSYGSGTSLSVNSLNDTADKIDITVTFPSIIIPGTYSYSTTITATY